MEEYSAGGDAPFDEQRITLEASGRGYLGGIRYFAAYGLRREWTLTVYAALRGGRDIYADGVFANTADMALRAVKRFDNDATLSLALLLPLSKRGLPPPRRCSGLRATISTTPHGACSQAGCAARV